MTGSFDVGREHVDRRPRAEAGQRRCVLRFVRKLEAEAGRVIAERRS